MIEIIKMIKGLIKKCKPVIVAKNSIGQERCFIEDEVNKIVYVFGPSSTFRTGFDVDDPKSLQVVEFENGPIISIGSEILTHKYATAMSVTWENDIPLVAITYGIKIKEPIRPNIFVDEGVDQD